MRFLESKRIWEFDYLDRRAALDYAYKKEYGMINESQLSASEFGLITMSDKTNALYELNPTAKRMRLFKQLDVKTYYGLSWTEFKKQTRAECDLQLEELQNDVVMAARVAANKEAEAKRKEAEAAKARKTQERWPGS